MLRRFLTASLSVLLLILSFPVTASAVSDVCYIERTGDGYSTVADAVEAAADGDTVVMLKDSVEKDYIDFETKSLTIKGNGKVIDTTSYNNCQFYNAFSHDGQTLTVENATLKNTRGFYIYPMTLNIIDCVIETGSEYGINIRERDGSPECKINISNTTWTVGEDGENASFVVMGTGSEAVFGSIDICNSQIYFYGNDSADKCNSMFYCNTTGNMSVNIENNSKLYLKGDKGQYFFHIEQSLRKLSLEEGCELVFAGGNGDTTFLNNLRETAITDKGAIWKNEGSADISISLPEITEDTSNFIGRAMDGKIYKPDITDFTLTAGSALRPVFLDADSFSMERGASLRTVKGELGIRFTSFVSNSLWEVLLDNATFRTYVAPLSNGEADPMGNTAKQKLIIDHENFNSEYKSGYISLHAAIIMDPEDVVEEKIYSLSLSARCEMTVKYSDGTESVFYTDFDLKDNTRSMSEVAYNLENYHNVTNEVTRHILKVCPYTAA